MKLHTAAYSAMRLLVVTMIALPSVVWAQGNPSREYVYLGARLIAFDGPPPPGITLTASAASSTAVNLTWSYTAFNPTGFKIEWKLSSNPTWDNSFDQNGATPTSYQVTNLTASTAYNFRVKVVMNDVVAGISNVETVTTPAAGSPDPPTCTNAQATSTTSITIFWDYNGSPITGFEIQRRQAGSNWPSSPTASVTAPVRNYADNGLSGSTTYEYRVRSVNNGLFSSYCNPTRSATTNQSLSGTPATPVLQAANPKWANCNAQPYTIQLDWTATDGDHTFIGVEAATDNQNWNWATSTIPSSGSTGNTEFQYFYGTFFIRIRAGYTNGNGEDVFSLPSNAIQVSAVQTVPANLVATSRKQNGQPQITLTWTAPSQNRVGVFQYRITRTTNNSSTILTAGCNATQFTDTGVIEGRTYSYIVQATDGSVNSTPTNRDFATTMDIPSVAAGTPVLAAQINLLRTAVNAVRLGAGQGLFGDWTDPEIQGHQADPDEHMNIKAVHIKEIRYRLRKAREAMGLSTTYATDPVPDDPADPNYAGGLIGIPVRKEHINELRANIKPYQ